MNKLDKLIEYLKLTELSLNQDLEQLAVQMDELDPNCKDYADLDIEHTWTEGQVSATSHILAVAQEFRGEE